MSTTTEILFNSAALHSLKREQLVKLCKIHSVKASGKNAELIERLQQRAQEIRRDWANTIRDEESAPEEPDDGYALGTARPSEQWEVVMEDIEEEHEGSTLGTYSSKRSLSTINGSAGEFGIGSSKVSSVSSSIKALASSLGLKRATSAKSTVKSSKSVESYNSTTLVSDARDLTDHAIPYSDLPPSTSLPQTDHFTLSALLGALNDDGDVSLSDPVPGSSSRPGVPAPADARLSLGTGVTTTIRLITTPNAYSTHDEPATPRLQPLQTTFDIQMGTPGADHSPRIWPASPEKQGDRLYPAVPFDDFPLLPPQPKEGDMPGALPSTATASAPAPQVTPAKAMAFKPTVAATPGPSHATDVFSPARAPAEPRSAARTPIPRSTPFVFGSPLPQHNISNKTFGQAATTVLEEMNRRLAETGTQQVDRKLVEGRAPGESIFGPVVGQPSYQRTDSTDRFEKVHEQVFNKMDSIATHYAARRGAPALAVPQQPLTKKRKSDAMGAGQRPCAKRQSSAAGSRVISTGVRKNMGIPGGFGADENNESDDDDEDREDLGDRRLSKRIRIADGEDIHKGLRPSIAPSAHPTPPAANLNDNEEQRKQREKDAIRRKLEVSQARRRSNRGGRVSVGTKPLPGTDKGKTSRFGFLSSAKSIVRNVWNMGATSKKTIPASSSIPLPKAPVVKPAPEPVAAAPPARKPALAAAPTITKNTISHSRTLLKPAPTTTASVQVDKGTVNSTQSAASRTRSPIPSFGAATRGTTPTMSTRPASLVGTAASKTGAISGSTGARMNSRVSTMSASSLGTRNHAAGISSLGTKNNIAGVSSLGTRSSLASTSYPGVAVSSTGTRRNLASTAAAGSTGPKRVLNTPQDSTEGGIVSKTRSSSLLAPTASSLAKMRPAAGRSSGLPVATKQQPRPIAPRKSTVSKAALTMISSSPKSPRPVPERIFSEPLSSPSLVPPPAAISSLTAAATSIMDTPSKVPTSAVPPKPQALVARKPRISRSRVIAKLGAHRAATQSSTTATAPPIGRTRSSMGARQSLGGVKANGRTSGGAELLRSAKKRARQSEFARRKSRADAAADAGDSGDMDVDN